VGKGIFQRICFPGLLLLLALGFPLRHPEGRGAGLEVPRLRGFLTGSLLVAQPHLRDPNFRRTVVFMVQHNAKGALGLVVNRPMGSVEFATLLQEMGADSEGIEGDVKIHYGGPVQPNLGIVLHTADSETKPFISVDARYAVTINAELLASMARSKGPKHTLLTLGYAGWGEGQLERELRRGDWAVAPASDEVLFDEQYETKWKRAHDSRYLDT
jgi:putative transcriptional regulator